MKNIKLNLWSLLILLTMTLAMSGCSDTNSAHMGNSTLVNSKKSIDTNEDAKENAKEIGNVIQKEKETQEDGADTDNADESSLEIDFIDVGQGSATLITCDNESMLVDAGDNSKGTLVQNYITKKNITNLKYVIGTHADADHIGGMDVIITKFNCENILMPDEKKDTKTYNDVIDAINYKNYKITNPVVGNEYSLGNASFTIISPVTSYSQSNNNSIVIILNHGDNSFYIGGDQEEEAEEDMVNGNLLKDVDVYLVGHHGSNTSTSQEILDVLKPEYAVISVGEGNSYGHPRAETLNKLRKMGVSVFRTDEQGSIECVSDGKNITWNLSPSESWKAGE